MRVACLGDKNPAWKGGRRIRVGYEGVRIHEGFYLLKHRLVMAQTIGRKLQVGEIVHHINRKRLDNRKENLALCSDRAAHNWCDTEEAKVFFG